MLDRLRIKPRLAAVIVGVFVAATAWAAPADDLKEAQKLYQQGKLQPALDKVEVYLKSQPRDPQGRFLKGLVLTEQKRVPEAIQVFTGLTEDFPELPEPYNNLAVLYASQGNYDKAKSALELAIHTHPSYATAHENLGDIYAQLASRAYDRALQLDKSNTTAQVKLSMIKDLFSSQKIAAATANAKGGTTTAPATTAAAAPPVIPAPDKGARGQAPSGTQPEPAKGSSESPKVAAAEPVKPAPAPVPPPPAPTKPEPPKVATTTTTQPSASSEMNGEITAMVEAWAKAWSSKDVKGYLAFYAPDFQVPGGASRSAWETERADRIERPKSIEVSVSEIKVKAGDKEATVTFRQSYRSDTLKSNNTKTLKLERAGDRWLIKQERAGG
jgi:Flp pilus assembly protein TadD/ketosteroid isomerase-like protein